jgi:hypothetical protein
MKKYPAALSFIIIILTVYWSINNQLPHRISGLDTPQTEFSTERALVLLKEITKAPHFTGTEYHKEVREFIISEFEKMGLPVEVQTQVAINKKWRAGTKTKNILTRIKGAENGKALLILTHYDSAPHSSYGASDAGSGVVTVLEGIRAFLAKGEKPKNDIIIAITDAEELGLLGANAFVNHHLWAKDIGLVINFEARGSGGPSYMLLETNGGNKKLIDGFKKAKPEYPVANSLLYSIYKMLPNDTDLTVFREDGNIDGFNFAFIDDHFDYHTAQDTYERLDRKTLQHQGEYLMPLLDYFSQVNLENLKATDDDVFFDFPGTTLVSYPFSWVLPMIIIASVWFLFLLIIGFKQKKLSVKEIFKGLLAFLMSLILSGAIAFYGWKLILKIYPQYNDILHGFTYNGHYYIVAFVALSAGIWFWIYNRCLKKNQPENLYIAPLFIWILINFAVALYLPGAGFFIIPLITGLLILNISLFSKRPDQNKTILFSLLIIPVLLIFVPLIQMFPVGLGLKMTAISTVLTTLVLGILLPVFAGYKEVKSLSNMFLLISVLGFVSAGFTSKYSTERKKPNSILYVYDADQNKAFWTSYDTRTDRFTQQFLGEDPTQGSFTNKITSSKYGTGFNLYKEADPAGIAVPEIDILKDTVIDEFRDIHLRIIPKRAVNRLELISKNDLHFKTFILNGEALKKKPGDDFIFDTLKKKNILSYFFTEKDTIIDLEFSIPKKEIPDMELFEASFDLYTNEKIKDIKNNFSLRDSVMMPTPFVLNDAVVVKKHIKFD